MGFENMNNSKDFGESQKNTPKISIFISDGGDPRLPKLVETLKNYGVYEILTEREGTVAESRNKMFQRSHGDIIVFIDTDQMPPNREWLKKLTDPIIEGKCDFTCGPTKPAPKPYYKSKYLKYFEISERNLYNRARVDPTIFPMGNSAWSRKVFETLQKKDGYVFDERFRRGGEDYDVNIRAIKYGFKGMCVEDAWVYHDQSNINTLGKIIKKKFKYAKWGGVALLKNNWIKKRIKVKYSIERHWIDILFQPMAMLYGLISAYMEWKKWEK